MKDIPYKIYLAEEEMPRYWYNVRADMKTKPAPLLNPAPTEEDSTEFAAPTEGADVADDYASIGLTLRRHPLALLRPRLAILDEADSGMDVDGVRALVELVGTLREQGSTFIHVSHYQHLIEQLNPDSVLNLEHGRIARAADPSPAAQDAGAGFGGVSGVDDADTARRA